MSDVVGRTLRDRGFDALYRHHADGIFVASTEGVLERCNAAAERLLGRPRGEIVGRPLDLPISSPPREERVARFVEAARGTPAHFVARVARGAVRPTIVDVTLLPLRDGDGVAGVLGILRDVTETSDLLESRDSNEALNRIAGEIARFAGWRHDVAANQTRWTDGITAILGAAPSAFEEREAALARFVQPRSRPLVAASLGRCIEDGEPFDVEIGLVDVAGRQIDARFTGEPVRDGAGAVVAVHGALIDVSEERRRAAHREVMERRVVETLNEISVAIFIISPQWRITFANRAGLDMLGVGLDFLASDTIWNLFPDIATSQTRPVYEAAMHEGVPGHFVEHVEFFGRWFEESVFPAADGIVVSARDVTSEYAAEVQAREFVERAAFLTGLLDLSRDALVVRDFAEGITYWNRAAEELYGWTFDEVRGRSTVDVLFADPGESRAPFEAVFRDGFWRGELHHRARDGRPVTVDCRLQLIYGEDGEPAGLFGVNTDITELAREREHRIRSQRMESIGTLAEGIAHDLNNVLTPVLMSIELLVRDEDDPGRRRLLDSMDASVKRGAEMIHQVMAFARGAEGERQQLSMSVVLFEFLQFCRDSLPASVELVAEVPDDLHPVRGDATQLLQVLVNLATNARDAMPTGGRLSVRARNGALGPPREDGGAGPPAVVVEVADTGTGMAPEVLARVFEPFFTTKPVGSGTGLGLSTSRGIVEEHGGRLLVSSAPGRGTTFTVLVPASLEVEPSARSEAPRAEVEGRGRRVLVVDDEPPILMAVDEVLRSRGFVVDVAQDGEAALATIDAAASGYDLIVTDLNMPRLGGDAMVGRVRERGLVTPVVYMSGVGDRVAENPDILFVSKPFATGDLLEIVARALGDAP